MSTELLTVDGTQAVVFDDGITGVFYDLACRVDGVVNSLNHALLGPAVNAFYGQALAALIVDRTLGGLVMDVHEGIGQEALGLDVQFSRDAYTAPTAAFGIHVTLPYWQPIGLPSKREAIFSAVKTAVEANTPGTDRCIRERVLAAFYDHLVTALAPLAVLRNADRPQRPQDGDRIILCDGDQLVNHDTMGRTWYSTRASVEIFVAGSSTATLDARVQQVRNAIRSADRLGGLAFDVEEDDTDPETLREAYTAAGLAAELGARLWFTTVPGDPYTLA